MHSIFCISSVTSDGKQFVVLRNSAKSSESVLHHLRTYAIVVNVLRIHAKTSVVMHLGLKQDAQQASVCTPSTNHQSTEHQTHGNPDQI